MPTNNSWNSSVLDQNVTLNGGTASIGTDATDNAINIGTAASAGRTIIIGNSTGTSPVSINCGTGAMNLGTNATAHTTTLGSITGSSPTTIQSGTGALNVTSNNGAMTIDPGNGNLSINVPGSNTVNFGTGGTKTINFGSLTSTSTMSVRSGTGLLELRTNNGPIVIDSGTASTTINPGTVAAASVLVGSNGTRTVTIGSTDGASSLALRYGTSDFTLASATGTVMSALDTGEITYPLQPAVLAYLSANTLADKTGDATNFVVICNTEVFDQNSDYNNSTGLFTAPITGRYEAIWNVGFFGLLTTHTSQISSMLFSNRGYVTYNNVYITANNMSQASFPGSIIADMDAADTVTFRMYVANGTRVVGITGSAVFGTDSPTFLSVTLVC